MKVYVVLVDNSYPYDPGAPEIAGVFSKRKDAEDVAGDLNRLEPPYDGSASVIEIELDSTIPRTRSAAGPDE